MRRVAAESFKTNGLGLFDEVQAEHETVAITKHGRPIAKLIPLNTETDEIYNFLKGQGAIAGDVVSPTFSTVTRTRKRSKSRKN